MMYRPYSTGLNEERFAQQIFCLLQRFATFQSPVVEPRVLLRPKNRRIPFRINLSFVGVSPVPIEKEVTEGTLKNTTTWS